MPLTTNLSALASAVTPALDKRVFAKLMPLLILAYVISFVDRTNIALAKKALEVDLGISAAAYGLGAGLFFLSYASMEIPSNLIMDKVGARLWIARIMITWGVLSSAMALVSGEYSFYAMRVLLGIAEAGLFPGIMLYMTYWFGKEQRAKATGYFLIGVCIANIISGPISGFLLKLDTVWGFHGWQWLFFLEGLPAVVLAFVVLRKLPDGPKQANWLSKDEAQALVNRVQTEQGAGNPNSHHHASFGAALGDPQIWLAISVYFCHQIAIYTVIFFLPTIIGAWGDLSPLTIGLLNSIPWVAAAIGSWLLPQFAVDPASSRRLLLTALAAMSAGLFIAAFSGPVLAMGGFCLALLVVFLAQSIIFAYPTSRLRGTALAGGLALVNTCGLVGGFIGPYVMGLIERSTGSTHNGIIAIACLLLVGLALATRLRMGEEERADVPVQAEVRA
jgi:sugar phosphate permease